MGSVLVCSECVYGILQQANDPDEIELKMLQDLHNKTFAHNAVIRPATMEDMLKYSKKSF